MRFFICAILFCCSCSEYVNNLKMIEKTWNGTIVFNDGSALDCWFTYDPIRNLLHSKKDTAFATYAVHDIKSFSFFDDEQKLRRYFYSLPLQVESVSSGTYFFEVIHPNSKISILSRLIVRTEVHQGKFILEPVYKTTQTVLYDYYERYLFDHRNGKFYELSKKNMLELIANNSEAMNYMYKKHYKLHRENIYQFAELIDVYSRN
jgi:hypothetical protein